MKTILYTLIAVISFCTSTKSNSELIHKDATYTTLNDKSLIKNANVYYVDSSEVIKSLSKDWILFERSSIKNQGHRCLIR